MIGRNHLRVVSERYNDIVIDGKSSISTIDAKVIDILIDYFVSKEDFEVAGVLSKWKSIPDNRFLETIIRFTNYEEVEHNKKGSKEEKESELDFGPSFINFGELFFNVYEISLISTGINWSKDRMCDMFYIEINSKSKIQSRLGGVRLEYKREDLRDRKLEELKNKLIEWGIKFI